MKINAANYVRKWTKKTLKGRIRKIREIIINWFVKTKWENLAWARNTKTIGNKIEIR